MLARLTRVATLTSLVCASAALGIASSSRRKVITGASAAAALAAVGASPAFAAEKGKASDGKWARRFEAFEDADFEGFSTSPTGLQCKVFEEGYGVKPKAGQKIKAHYAGYLLSGAKFDASYDRGSPLSFDVGMGRVIKGWDEALLDMQVGEKRILKIPSSLGAPSVLAKQ